MSDPKNYTEMQEYLNIESYIDYVMLCWFGGMGDWPGNNWWGANRNNPPEPFEYFLWDAEWSWETTRGHNNGWVAPDFRSNDSGGPTIAAIWHSLRAKSDFMMLFADRAYKHLFNDGALTNENCIERYLALNEARFSIGPVAESLRITEIMYHPENTGEPGDPNTEFIERINIAAQTVNLNLVSFDKGINFTFPEMKLPAGGHVLIVKDTAAFETRYRQNLNVAG